MLEETPIGGEKNGPDFKDPPLTILLALPPSPLIFTRVDRLDLVSSQHRPD